MSAKGEQALASCGESFTGAHGTPGATRRPERDFRTACAFAAYLAYSIFISALYYPHLYCVLALTIGARQLHPEPCEPAFR